MKRIYYHSINRINEGTDENPIWTEIKGALTAVTCEDTKLDIVLEEVTKIAWQGETQIEEFEQPVRLPTVQDRIEAQVTYTAMMTDTLLED